MQKRGYLGICFQIIGGILLLNAGQGITGWVVAEELSVSVSGILGLVFLLGGLGLTLWQHRTYDSYEPVVRRAMGDQRYEALPESSQQSTLKAYRRHENTLEKTAQSHARQEIKSPKYALIRTEQFEKAIQGHPRERIERALHKLEEGKMNLGAERMSGGPLKGLYRIKVTDTARIVYDFLPKHRIKVIDFTANHDYRKTTRKLGKN